MAATSNKYCSLSDLNNESDVEQFLVLPLLNDLGYSSQYLKTKTAISGVQIDKGKRRRTYIPDYLAFGTARKDNPLIVLDAKAPNVSVEDGLSDAQLYASVIRRTMKEPKPDQICIGVNGHRVIVKHFDTDQTMHELAFADLVDSNAKFEALKNQLHRTNLVKGTAKKAQTQRFGFKPLEPAEIPALFEVCHRAIWKAEKRSPASAFYEFAKIMFVKINEDRRIRESAAAISHDLSAQWVPTDMVRFSKEWIEEMEGSTDDPVNTILFARLTKELDTQIALGKKKRIFESGEAINLAPSTIKDAGFFLEHFDLYSVDEDLNGRLFETFLTATMRGKALGQFFTPRSVVKFMVQMAGLSVTKSHLDSVLDGCCGTGGFLIEAMADMGMKLQQNKALTSAERESLLEQLKTERLWGIDAGKDPQMARIARLNMLLHRDGGSRIYYADSLDKQLRVESGLPLQTRLETDELRNALEKGLKFDCVLTNPPFSMTYEKKKPAERAVLSDYALFIDQKGKERTSLRSSVLFLERYWDLLRPGGRLLTVMDESVLNTLTNRPFREFLLDKFVVHAVVSLPRNTFVKAQGSVRTSVLYLTRKDPTKKESQPAVLMALVDNVGHSDSGKERPEQNQLPSVLSQFVEFINKGTAPGAGENAFLVNDLNTNNPTLRLDAHYFNPDYFDTMARLDEVAAERGWETARLEDLLVKSANKITGGATPKGALYPHTGPKFIRVQNVRPYQLVWDPDDPCIDTRTHQGPLKRSQLQEDDVVFTITGSYGIAAVVPKGFGEANINQHSVRLRVGDAVLPEFLSVFLNSELCRPQIDRAVTGSSRLALDYEAIRNLKVVYPKDIGEQEKIVKSALSLVRKSRKLRDDAAQYDQEVSKVLEAG